ncbi:FAD-dependent oxidoreductase, partial [Candidatus Roizmanbacteria bacterium]|nr:FAD-dependent oxidoreductase [Candidatus Roizmanbacteria bacterium]
MYDVIIIGSGPAGLTAGIYTSRAALKTLILAGKIWGGQLQMTTEVENYPGFPEGIMGPELMMRMRKQAERFGTTMVDEDVTGVDFTRQPFTVSVGQPKDPKIQRSEDPNENNKTSYQAKSIIVATGADTVWLGVPGEQQLIGHGVSSCAPCDAFFYKNKNVIVVGGGDSAMEEALVLTKFATNVIIVHRRGAFRASKIMQDRVMKHPKIKVLWDTVVIEIKGQQKVTSVVLNSKLKSQNSPPKADLHHRRMSLWLKPLAEKLQLKSQN